MAELGQEGVEALRRDDAGGATAKIDAMNGGAGAAGLTEGGAEKAAFGQNAVQGAVQDGGRPAGLKIKIAITATAGAKGYVYIEGKAVEGAGQEVLAGNQGAAGLVADGPVGTHSGSWGGWLLLRRRLRLSRTLIRTSPAMPRLAKTEVMIIQACRAVPSASWLTLGSQTMAVPRTMLMIELRFRRWMAASLGFMPPSIAGTARSDNSPPNW